MKKEVLKQAAMNHPQMVMAPYDAIMEMHGFDAVYTVVEQIGGATIYVPTIRTVFYDCIVEEARREYCGCNIAQVSRKYGFSERGLRKIFKRMS